MPAPSATSGYDVEVTEITQEYLFGTGAGDDQKKLEEANERAYKESE